MLLNHMIPFENRIKMICFYYLCTHKVLLSTPRSVTNKIELITK